MAISSQESKAIAILKTSLVFFVIYGHMNPDTVSFAEADFPILSFRGISNALAIAISYTFAHAIVPTYFLLSGYSTFLPAGSTINSGVSKMYSINFKALQK